MSISQLLPLRTGRFPIGKVGSAKGGTVTLELKEQPTQSSSATSEIFA